jgi:hypothetical protein
MPRFSVHRSSCRRRGIFRWAWLAGCLAIAGSLAYAAVAARTSPAQPAANVVPEPSALRTQRIEEIRVGDWVLARNPELTDAERAATEEVDPATWRKLSLRMRKADGSRLDIELLRPIEWIEANAIEPGATIPLNLPEMGVSGPAEVLALNPCRIPGPKPHPDSRLVTGTFAHSSADIVDLFVEGLDKPIGCTANHRFWSEDRQEFVEAGQLQLGDALVTAKGTVTHVNSLLPRPDREAVYNLEIGVAHVFHVSQHGLLVHNVYPAETELFKIDDGVRRSKAAELTLKDSIPARIKRLGQPDELRDVPLDSLRSPKSEILADSRFLVGQRHFGVPLWW